jgi:DNA-binding XRE family transcriptional regulator
MSVKTEFQIIKQGGVPAFVVIPYDEYMKSAKKKPRIPVGDSVPHEVVGLMIDHDYTIIRAWREYMGLTQKEVADKMGITQAAYSQMESARRLKKITKTRIATAFGINPEQV